MCVCACIVLGHGRAERGKVYWQVHTGRRRRAQQAEELCQQSHGDGTALGGTCRGRVGGRNYARREGLVLINAF